ncbi:MAG TPA: hypothetical protein VIY48_15765 [Candidatus Paceibacterota bacterium]
MININVDDATGITVGQRKDGSRAVLWSNDVITWYDQAAFTYMLWLSETSILAEEV